ncbi:hypothetical protein CRUP_010919 [Coryphaenoides rupestris]|nr:hypothetical protein CRUP_010919 [Coryphaenoides rupestris]
MSFIEKSRRSWIEETFSKRDCVIFIPSTRDLHRCCCGRLIGEHPWQDIGPPMSMTPSPRAGQEVYVRVAVDSKAEAVLQLMLREWQMERPKLLISVQGGTDNILLPPKVRQAFSKGLLTAALSTGAWIFTDGINTGVSKCVGEAVKAFGSHNLRKRNTVGITPWGTINNNNNNDLIGRDVYRPYQPLGNPLSKRACLNNFHSHYLLVDDGTMGKYGCQQGFRRRLEKHIHLQRIHPRLNQGVPVVCVVVEGGPTTLSTVLDYVSSEPPVDADLQEDFLDKIGKEFGVDRREASDIFGLLLKCMDYRQSVSTNASPAEQLRMVLAWDRADIAKEQVLVYGQHWQSSMPRGYRLSVVDMGLVIEYLIGGAYCSTYTRKPFRAAHSLLRIQNKQEKRRGSSGFLSKHRHRAGTSNPARSPQQPHFFRTAQPYKCKESEPSPGNRESMTSSRRQQMALFLWQHGEEALARATAACKMYRSMAWEARQSNMDDVMAMKLLTSEMEAWSHFTCLQMAVSSGHRPFVSHSCTQTLLTDLWTGSLNMRKNSFPQGKRRRRSQAEMCHVPQSQEAPLFGRDPASRPTASDQQGEQHKISYLLFLLLFSYTILVKMGDYPSVQEWFVISYILSTAVEKTREVLMSEPRKLSQKLKIWFSEYWNVSDFVAIVLFMAGLVLRWQTGAYRMAGRISYCLDIIFWFVRVLDLLAVNQHAGPYLTMITKMTSNMFFIVVMMAIVLLSFGVSRKAILSPNEEPSWSLAVDVVFQPYWMMFGEAVYLFVQYIIMVNILIAFFNNVYFDMASTSNMLWKYNRYRYIMTYQDRPWLPPPFILLSHVGLGVSALCRRLRGSTKGRGSGLKLYLCQEDKKRLYEFEDSCLRVHIHQKNQDLLSNQKTRIKATAERTEEMTGVVGEFSERVHSIQDSLSALDAHLGRLQDMSALAVDTLNLFSASDSLQHRGGPGLLAPYRPAQNQRPLPHSWTLRCGGCEVAAGTGAGLGVRRGVGGRGGPKAVCQSTPPSLLRGSSRLALPPEIHVAVRRSRNRSPGRSDEKAAAAAAATAAGEESPSAGELLLLGQRFCPIGSFPMGGGGVGLWDRSPSGSPQSPPPPHGHPGPGAGDNGEPWEQHHHGHRSRGGAGCFDPSILHPGQSHPSMDEAAEEEEEEGEDKPSSVLLSGPSIVSLLPSYGRCGSSPFTKSWPKPAVGPVDEGQQQPPSRSRAAAPLPSSQWARVQRKPFRWACMSRERPYGRCHSLSSSVENITFAGAPLSPLRGSFSFLAAGPLNGETSPPGGDGRDCHFGASLRGSRSEEWSKSSDFGLHLDSKARGLNKKTVKIQEVL